MLILANNEADVIETTIRSIRLTLESDDAVFVIADNCQDDTAGRATEAGAIVYPRSTSRANGKGAALRWFLEQAGDSLSDFDLIIILDADSQVPGDFLRNVKASYEEGKIMQYYVQPARYRDSMLSTLIALSEINEQRTVDRLRNLFGWPVRLRGRTRHMFLIQNRARKH